MRSTLFILQIAIGLVATAMSQGISAPNEGSRLIRLGGNSYSFKWSGHLGRSYFLQHSEDLVTWTYFPDVIETGTNSPLPLSYGVTVSGPNRFFLRLKYSEVPTIDPKTADFDGDGLSNWDELQRGTGPFARDSDGDGMSDGNEFLIGRNPLLADSPVDGSDRLLDVHTPLAP